MGRRAARFDHQTAMIRVVSIETRDGKRVAMSYEQTLSEPHAVGSFRPLRPAVRLALIVAGTFFVGLGAVGAVLPGLPTTPFILLAAACYARSSERFYRRLINSRLVGPHYHNLRQGRGLSLRVKLSALAVGWVFMGYSAVFVFESPYMQALMIGLMITQLVVMGKIKTLQEAPPKGPAVMKREPQGE